jgi:acetyltransferase-like isoleucine patch superfamily enzyme
MITSHQRRSVDARRGELERLRRRRSVRDLLVEELWTWLEASLGWIPGRVGRGARGLVYRPFVKSRGFVDVAELTHIRAPRRLRCGRGVSIGRLAQLTCGGGLDIGDDVMIAQQVIVITNGHRFSDLGVPMREQGLYGKPVVIEDDVWLGAGSLVMPGVRIGRGAVVAGGAVVTGDVAPMSIVAGVPARLVRRRSGDRPSEVMPDG